MNRTPCQSDNPSASGSGRSHSRPASGPSLWCWPFAAVLFATTLLAVATARAATFSEWQHRQEFHVPAAGLIKFSLPPETLDAARADLADLRLADDAGNEVPYVLERPAPAGKVVRPARSFAVELTPAATVIRLKTGLARPLGGVTLVTAAPNFIKAVAVEGSADGREWKPLVSGQPVFRLPNNASQLRIPLPPGIWPFLRLTVDDRASQPVPFTGAEIEAAEAEPAPTEPVSVRIAERFENPEETRLVLDLGAAHLRLAELAIETPEALFRRQVTLSTRQVLENTITEKVLAEGTIYRVAVQGQPASARLAVPVEADLTTRELLVTIQNGDSPPLQLGVVRALRRPVYLVFLAARAGGFQLFTGNPLCAAPRYDLAAQGIDLKGAPLTAIQPGAIAPNPAYRPPEALPQVQDTGAALDVAAWRFRKAVKIEQPGVQQVELDPDVLAGAQHGLADLRLLRDGRQLPYVIERTGFTRQLKPEAARADDPKQPRLSRWSLKLTHPRLPVTRLTCTSPTPLFRRSVTLYEQATDERGGRYRRDLGRAAWEQSPERAARTLALHITTTPLTDRLILETHNADNPPVELANFEIACPVTRLCFKTTSTGEVWLYYGNPTAPEPRYDLSLVAGQLVSAQKQVATLGPQEQLKKPSWAEGGPAGKGGVLFWVVLGLVVLALLWLISRLLPQRPEATQ